MSLDKAPPNSALLRFEAHITSLQTYRSFSDIPRLVWRALREVINVDNKAETARACQRIAEIFGVTPCNVHEMLDKYPALPRQALKNRYELVRQSKLTRTKLASKIFPINKINL